ncbi:helix-turn-helix transcriptional regulator [Luteimonas aquatica]|uniref:helix-turn-helix transcriptional regulator n=1 Tax=Luteimonas aquatica TaxID=450364 RepID=UPI001F5830E8|nr:WYL domain-containing protein [Luteimonas aquatica]
MLASRLLSILMLLQTRGRMSARALAAEFEVAVRTIHRDIDQLSAAGIPVYAERGRGGGFRLRDGYRTMLTGLNQSEAETLFLAGLPGPAAQLGVADALSTARLKLLAALPPDMQLRAERIAARFHLDAESWFHDADLLPSLPAIARAVWSERMLRLRYRRSGETEARPRRLAPLGLVLKGGIWYLVARSGKSVRTYRAANIHDAEICEETFERPAGFDLVAHWERAVREYEAGVYHELADVRLSPQGVYMLELLGPYVVRRAAETAGKPDRRGWVRCQLPLESFGFGIRELMRLGEEVVVLGPPALRAQLAATAARIAGLHRDRPTVRRTRRQTGM